MVLITRPALALLAASASLRPSQSLASTVTGALLSSSSSSSHCPSNPSSTSLTRTPLDRTQLQLQLQLQRPFSAMSSAPTTDPQTTPASPEFVQERLSTLLNSPYIHFSQPHIPGLRLGHGPVDLFSTRFGNYFTHDATARVAGRELDRDGLKEALLALQKRWNPDTASFVSVAAAQGEGEAGAKPKSKFVWTQKDAGDETEVTASADVKEEGGTQRIHRLTLDGDEALFS
ncbi:hypothetical protein GSI_05712 [Ganoderma sinense ZZ0214-1]|uniref:Uncharacterized protein n=1 Tax=Ganoderma sinense ZZ0214-1 TaxID=1077348 RepID=A0A2G8SBP2_9APHY|nr:hypothetical protein GSI_05712 [Ganoderma sinense ZZ0214-1]